MRRRIRLKNLVYLLVPIILAAPTTGITGIQEPWDAIRDNPSFYEINPLDYLWVVNTVSPEKIPKVAMPPELFQTYRGKVIGSFQRLVHASPDYMQWLDRKYGVDEQQRRENGVPHQPFAPANFFVVPTENRIEWHWLLTRKAIDLGAQQVMYEEPEFWMGTGYSDVMKKKYLETYGEEVVWRDYTCTFLQRWRMERLKETVLAHAYLELFKKVKEKNSEIKAIIPMHDIASYQLAKITSPFVQNIKNPYVDVIQSQTWDWALEWANDEKIAAYVDLAYWVFSSKFRNDLELWLLTDPVNDPLQVEIQNLRNYRAAVDAGILLGFYTHHIPWPRSRIGAIRNAGWWEYEMEVRQNFNIHRSRAKFGRSRITRESFPKIGFLYSQARNYVTYPSKEKSGRLPIQEVMKPFAEYMLQSGQKFQVLETELIDQPGMLDDLAVLVADGEAGGFIPVKSCADALLKWIHSGGILLWLGDPGSFQGVPLYHSSSLGYIAERTDLSLGKMSLTHPGKVGIDKVGGTFDLRSSIYLRDAFTFKDATGAEILYRLPDGSIFAWSKGYGEGKLVYFGYPCYDMLYGTTEHWPIIRHLLEEQGVHPNDDGLIRFERRVNDLESYETIWLPKKSGSVDATVATKNWTGEKETDFIATVKGSQDLVIMKTPYFSVFSEDVIPVDTRYGDTVVEVMLESRGRSWRVPWSSEKEKNQTAFLFLPSPDRVERIFISGKNLEPSELIELPLNTYNTRMVIHFNTPLPFIPTEEGRTQEPVGGNMGLVTVLLGVGIVLAAGLLAKRRFGSKAGRSG